MADDTIVVPHLGVNDTAATLVAWHVADGDGVTKGDVVCELETAKATFEVEAPDDGVVVTVAALSAEVAVGETLALVGADQASLEERKASLTAQTAEAIEATDKARRLSEELGVDLRQIPSTGGIIRERDVREFAEGGSEDPMQIADIGGRLDPELKRQIADDPSFPGLSSEEKVARYRAAGARIGEGMKFGHNAMIVADAIELGPEVEIGAETRIVAETISMGRMSLIGPRSKVTCRHIRIADMLFTGSEITIGGSDRFSDTDRLLVDDLCLISARCFLDTGNGIRLGREVGLSPFVKLYTHQHWQNVLEGYRANFGPIVIQDGAYVTGDCLVTPGVRIGKGATVLANSTVAANVEPYTVVSGNPAKQVGTVERDLTPERKERIVKRLLNDMKQGLKKLSSADAVIYQPVLNLDRLDGASVVLTLNCAGREGDIGDGLTVFDLAAYRAHGAQSGDSDEVRNFLRRRGIRLSPIHWRYKG